MIFYLIGVIISLLLCRYNLKRINGGYMTNGDWVMSIIYGILSWLGIIMLLILFLPTIGDTDWWNKKTKH